MPQPDADLQDPLLISCRALWQAMDDFEEKVGRHLGVGRSDLRALNLLEHGPLNPAVMADRLGLRRGSVTALIDRLETAGYVVRTGAPDDRRAVLVELTPATWRRLAAVYRPMARRVHKTSQALTDTDRAAAVSALATITAAFAEQG